MTKLFTEFLQSSEQVTAGDTPTASNAAANTMDAHGMVESLSRIIEKQLEPMLLFKNFFKLDRQLARTGGRVRRFPKKSATNATEFFEAEDVPANTPGIDRSYVEVELTKFGALEIVTSEMIDDADFAVINDVKESLLDAMARFYDRKALNGMLNALAVTVPETFDTEDSSADIDLTLANDKVLQINTITVTEVGGVAQSVALVLGDDYLLDGLRGKVQIQTLGTNIVAAPVSNNADIDVDITYTHIDDSTSDFDELTALEVGTTGQLDYADVVTARTAVKLLNGMPDTFVTDLEQMADLLKDDKFLIAHGGTKGESIVTTGQVGRLAGMNMWESNTTYEATSLCFKTKDIGWEVQGRPLTSRMEIIQGRMGDQRIMVEIRNAYAVVRPELICVMFNGGAGSVSIP